jgi:Lipocalin-like domain
MMKALRETIIGAWELVSYIERDSPDGAARYPHGEDALGLIMYTPDGYMSAQIMTPGRPAYDQPIARGGTAEQAAAAALGYLAYSGPYSVDESTGTVHHHVAVSLLPNWLGSTQVRHTYLDGDQLTITSTTPLTDGGQVWSTLVWARARADSQVSDAIAG